jgi:hypothetical protein
MRLSQIGAIIRWQIMIAVICYGCSAVATLSSHSSPPAPSASSQDLQVGARVDAYIENEMRNRAIPGLALVVIKDGKIVCFGPDVGAGQVRER